MDVRLPQPADDFGRRHASAVRERAEDAAADRDAVHLGQDLLREIIPVHDQVDLVGIEQLVGNHQGRCGDYVVDVPAGGDHGAAFLVAHHGLALELRDVVVIVDADPQLGSKLAGPLEELDVPPMEQVADHVCVHAYPVAAFHQWIATLRKSYASGFHGARPMMLCARM